MRSFTVLATLATILPSTFAHYRWTSLLNPSKTGDYEFVRLNTNYNSPVTDVTSKDIICNAGGLATGGTTKTATVAAGSTVGFALDQAIYHNGPIQVYMSKAPSTAATYDGSGNWFKIATLAPACGGGGCTWANTQVSQFSFKIPAKTPPGQYLLRIEQIGLHSASARNGAQFYISCAHVDVTGSGGGTPGPLVKFPGAYKPEDPGLMINIYYPVPTTYTMPGPAVWGGN